MMKMTNHELADQKNFLFSKGDLSTIIQNPHKKFKPGESASQMSNSKDGQPYYRNGVSYGLSDEDIQMVQIFNGFRDLTDKFQLPNSILYSAVTIYKNAIIVSEEIKKDGYKGTIACACIYVACIKEKVPRTFQEMSDVAKVGKAGITRAYNRLKETLTEQVVLSAEDFLPRFFHRLDVKEKLQKVVLRVVKKEL